jgi:hypothetical protein
MLHTSNLYVIPKIHTDTHTETERERERERASERASERDRERERTFLMAWLLQSAMRRLESLSTAMPRGMLKRASRPWPSTKPFFPPASSAMTPVGDTVMIAKCVLTNTLKSQYIFLCIVQFYSRECF